MNPTSKKSTESIESDWMYKDSVDPDYTKKLTWWLAPYGGREMLETYGIYAMAPTTAHADIDKDTPYLSRLN